MSNVQYQQVHCEHIGRTLHVAVPRMATMMEEKFGEGSEEHIQALQAHGLGVCELGFWARGLRGMR